jgi:Domain of unknown function (DUF4214)
VTVTVTDVLGRTATVTDRVVDPPALSANQGAVDPPALSASQSAVARLYQDILGRQADSDGLAFWSRLVDQGATIDQVAQGFLASPENVQKKVEDAYHLLLHRSADLGGLNNFTDFLQKGGTVEQMDAMMAGSVEYWQNRAGGTAAGFLAALYQDALNRPTDPFGETCFASALQQGASARSIADAVLGSAEHRQLQVERDYQRYLGRDADAWGLSVFTRFLQTGGTENGLIGLLVASPEFATLANRNLGR